MPRRDGTGPNGMGSQTGRGLGMCTGVNAPAPGWGFNTGYGRGGGLRARNGLGNGFGPGFRGGRQGWSQGGGRRRGQVPEYAAGYSTVQETLEERAAYLEAELAALKQRMEEMNKANAD